MGQLKVLPIIAPGSYGVNQGAAIVDDQAMRFASLATNGTIDAKGRLTSRKDFVLQTSGYSGGYQTLYRHVTNTGADVILGAGAGVVRSGIGTLTSRFDYTAGSQFIDVGGAKLGATATGLANSAEVYGFTVAVDGGAATQISVTGSAAQTYTALVSEINADLVGASCAIRGGNLFIFSDTTGASSSIAIGAGKGTASNALLTTLTNFRAVRTASTGTTTRNSWQFASLSKKIFMAQASQMFTCLNEDDYAVESIVGQPWTGSPNCVIAADGRLWVADDASVTTSGYQVVDVGGNKTGASATDLVAATTYTASVIVDGSASQAISIVGSTALTFATLITQLDTDIAGATVSIVDGNLRITSDSGGTDSTVAITAGTLFAAPLNGFVAVNTAVAGAATGGGNRHTVWWSDLLNGKSWDGGDAGSLNVQNTWPTGQDSIVGLEMLNGRLLIFGRNNLLLYTLPADHNPASMSLTDAVEGIGCIARDSIQIVNGDLYFLSRSGIYKIPRLAQVTSLLNLQKISLTVEEDLLAAIAAETLTLVRSGVNPRSNLYALSFPTSNDTFVVHTDRKIPGLPNEPPAITIWTNSAVPFEGFAFDADGEWYCAMRNGVAKYTGYTSDGTSNNYDFEVYTQWLGDGSKESHFKVCALVLEAVSGKTGTGRWRTDFKEGTTFTAPFTCTAEEFAENPGLGETMFEMTESGGSVKVGFTTAVTSQVTLHAIRIYNTGGKLG